MSGWGATTFSIIFYLCALQVAYISALVIEAWAPQHYRWALVYWLVVVLSINIQVLVVH